MTDEGTSLKHQEPDIEREHSTAVRCTGSWTLPQLTAFEGCLRAFSWPNATELEWNVGAIDAMDTAGAWLFQRTMHPLQSRAHTSLCLRVRPEHATLLHMISRDDLATLPPASSPSFGWLAQLGRAVWTGV